MAKQSRIAPNPAKNGTGPQMVKEVDLINHPPHYTSGKIEVIDFIEDQQLGFHLGQVVKYVARAGKKGVQLTLQDLKKAQWYLNRHITNLEKK